MSRYDSLNLKRFNIYIFFFGTLVFKTLSVSEKNNSVLCTDTQAAGLQSGRYGLRCSILHQPLNKAASH